MWRQIIVWILGFSSGLPLALSAGSLQTWLTVSEIDIATIGFFALVGLPYTFKFLWAPLMDRFELPMLPRRKGWIVLTQGAIAFVLFLMSQQDPKTGVQGLAMLALGLAFLSASQDIVIDAYRADVLLLDERGLGSSMSVFGYRLAMILSGGIAFVWADQATGFGWTWNYIYQVMSFIMLGLMFFSLVGLPKLGPEFKAPKTEAAQDLIGCAALIGAMLLVYFGVNYGIAPSVESQMVQLFINETNKDSATLVKRWADLLSLVIGLAVAIPLAFKIIKLTRFETLTRSLSGFTFDSKKQAWTVLIFIVLYKLGDAFAGSLTSPFLIKGVGFSQAEIGVVNKVIGIWLTILGAILGGVLLMRLRLFKGLMLFGVLQLVSNAGFLAVAYWGKGSLGSFMLPAFDLWIASLKETTNIDVLLLLTIGFENLSGGMGTAAFVAFLMSLCSKQFTATQFSLLSAFASVGRVWVGPLAGVLAPTIGWTWFFGISIIIAAPGLILLYGMRDLVRSLSVSKQTVQGDD